MVIFPTQIPGSLAGAGSALFGGVPRLWSSSWGLYVAARARPSRERSVPVADRALGKPAGALWMASGVVPGTPGRSFGVGCVYTPLPRFTFCLPPFWRGGAWGRRQGRVRAPGAFRRRVVSG